MIAARLAAAAASWEREADVIVVGSGVAGMTVALGAARARRVLLVTKDAIDAGSTSWAQGGIAAVIDLADDTEQHLRDTLVAGAGLCSERAVRILVEEGPAQLAELISRGLRLDTDADGALELTREGGHGRARIVHAGGDATGADVQRALVEAVRREPGIEIVEGAFVLDCVRGDDGTLAGVRAAVIVDGEESIGIIRGRAVVLACGGIGQVYASTTNPPVSTGDGMALALRAGAKLADVEFVQFHPTVLWQGADARGQQLLVSEAVRGEGAVLLDQTGARVMAGIHPLGDLAPRDIVAKAMSIRMAELGVDHLLLDATGIGEATLLHRFPTIIARCRALGIDPVRLPIPVAPGEHFACGGVWTDRNGRTSIRGLFAVGETACTGVHGANRLASNSLLEGLVYGDRVGAQVVLNLPVARAPAASESDEIDGPLPSAATAAAIGALMSREAAMRRSAESLARARSQLDELPMTSSRAGDRHGWEAANIHAIARVLAEVAAVRDESRGCHWRVDHPETDPAWQRRTVAQLVEGELELGQVGLEETP